MMVPNMGDSITEGSILEWLKNEGDYVAVDDIIAVIETDKVAVDVRADTAGTVTKLHAEVDDVVEVGAQLVDLLPGPPPEGYEVAAATSAPAAEAASAPAPAVAATQPAAPAKAAGGSPKPAAAPIETSNSGDAGFSRTENRVPMTRLRKVISKNLKNAQDTAAMLTTFQEVDMTGLIDLRKKYKDAFMEKHGVKLGFNSAFIKAGAMALMDIPVVNAAIDGDEIIYRSFADISFAVATPTGLMTPVLRNVESLSIAGIEQGMAALVDKARTRKITLEDLAGGTFSVTNGGVYGSMMSTPILNMPQTAILGMHATKSRPMVVNGEVKPRPVMYLAMSYDHRLIDGREAVTFLCNIRDKIEDPVRMFLDC
jgi:2-oxoglutarate dehydrogenase E2 component (dihydrolipoamide succinyltransferase)